MNLKPSQIPKNLGTLSIWYVWHNPTDFLHSYVITKSILRRDTTVMNWWITWHVIHIKVGLSISMDYVQDVVVSMHNLITADDKFQVSFAFNCSTCRPALLSDSRTDISYIPNESKTIAWACNFSGQWSSDQCKSVWDFNYWFVCGQ